MTAEQFVKLYTKKNTELIEILSEERLKAALYKIKQELEILNYYDYADEIGNIEKGKFFAHIPSDEYVKVIIELSYIGISTYNGQPNGDICYVLTLKESDKYFKSYPDVSRTQLMAREKSLKLKQ